MWGERREGGRAGGRVVRVDRDGRECVKEKYGLRRCLRERGWEGSRQEEKDDRIV